MAHVAYTDTVQKVYIAYYGRAADPGGLAYWEDQLAANNGDLASIMNLFGTSSEATSLFGSLTNKIKVNTLYSQIFGRDADEGGLDYYSAQLSAGTMTGVSIAQNILDGASGSDAKIIANKLAVAKAFTAWIVSSEQIGAYGGNAAASSARNMLATVDAATVVDSARTALVISTTIEGMPTATYSAAGSVKIIGTIAKGQVLTADASSITNKDGIGPLSFQWLRDGTAVTGATTNTFTLSEADVGKKLSVYVTYSDLTSAAKKITVASTNEIVNSSAVDLNFGINKASDTSIKIFSSTIKDAHSVAKISTSEDRIYFTNFNADNDIIKIADKNEDGLITTSFFSSGARIADDLIMFENEFEIYDVSINFPLNSSKKVYLYAQDTGNLYDYSEKENIPEIIKIAEIVSNADNVSNIFKIDSALAGTKLAGPNTIASESYFQNSYSLTVNDIPDRYWSISEQLLDAGETAIKHMANYIKWEGKLDFVIHFDQKNAFGFQGQEDVFKIANYKVGMPAYNVPSIQADLVGQHEALFGVDTNGDYFDLGTYLLTDSTPILNNYGTPLYINRNQTPENDSEVPDGHADFFGMFIHEVIHGFGMVSTVNKNTPIISDNVIEIGGRNYLNGDNVINLLGAPLLLDDLGHYDSRGTTGNHGGMMYRYGRYENSRWELGQIELAILQDMGFTVAPYSDMPLLDVDHWLS